MFILSKTLCERESQSQRDREAEGGREGGERCFKWIAYSIRNSWELLKLPEQKKDKISTWLWKEVLASPSRVKWRWETLAGER